MIDVKQIKNNGRSAGAGAAGALVGHLVSHNLLPDSIKEYAPAIVTGVGVLLTGVKNKDIKAAGNGMIAYGVPGAFMMGVDKFTKPSTTDDATTAEVKGVARAISGLGQLPPYNGGYDMPMGNLHEAPMPMGSLYEASVPMG